MEDDYYDEEDERTYENYNLDATKTDIGEKKNMGATDKPCGVRTVANPKTCC